MAQNNGTIQGLATLKIPMGVIGTIQGMATERTIRTIQGMGTVADPDVDVHADSQLLLRKPCVNS